MAENPGAVLIYTTLPDEKTAHDIGEALVKARLAACVNIFAGMRSIYEWKGELCRDAETAMLIKTMTDRADAAMAELKRLHPYETPAVLLIDVADVAADYLDWMIAQTRP